MPSAAPIALTSLSSGAGCGCKLAAADLLRDPDTTLAAVARRVGYSSPFALSTAFKRARGVSPREHRAASA